jgi:hypothetical protein
MTRENPNHRCAEDFGSFNPAPSQRNLLIAIRPLGETKIVANRRPRDIDSLTKTVQFEFPQKLIRNIFREVIRSQLGSLQAKRDTLINKLKQ